MRRISMLVAVSVVVVTGAVFSQSDGGRSQQPAKPASALPQGAAETLPKDVYPESRNRLPLVKREEMDELGKKAYDEAVSNTRSLAGLQGPSGIRLHSPRLAEAVRPVNAYLRFETDLGRRLSELAILVTARELDHQFEWAQHEPAALKAGLEQTIIDVVKHRKPITTLGEKERAIVELGREVFGKRSVSPETFARASKLFGNKGLVDLASLMGNYASTSILLTVFDQQLPPGEKPLLPVR